MAGLQAVASNRGGVALTDAVNPKTVLQVVAPSNKGIRITRFAVLFDGTSSTAARPVVSCARTSTNGTGTSLNPQKTKGHTGAVTATAFENFTEEPTVAAGSSMYRQPVPPTAGVSVPVDIQLNPGEAFNVRVAANGINATAFIDFEE